MATQSAPLSGKRIAFLATNGFEQMELTQPWQAIKSANAIVKAMVK
jgi:protease I